MSEHRISTGRLLFHDLAAETEKARSARESGPCTWDECSWRGSRTVRSGDGIFLKRITAQEAHRTLKVMRQLVPDSLLNGQPVEGLQEAGRTERV